MQKSLPEFIEGSLSKPPPPQLIEGSLPEFIEGSSSKSVAEFIEATLNLSKATYLIRNETF